MPGPVGGKRQRALFLTDTRQAGSHGGTDRPIRLRHLFGSIEVAMPPQTASVERALSPWMASEAARVDEVKFSDLLKCDECAVDKSVNYA